MSHVGETILYRDRWSSQLQGTLAESSMAGEGA